MSMSVANAKNTLFTLRFPPDKIVDVIEDSFTAVASSTAFSGHRTEHPIDHTFGDTVFLDMTWSQDGGTTWQPMMSCVPNLSTPTQPVLQTCMVGCYSTSTQIVIVASNYTTTAQTIMFKIVPFWKD